MESFDALHAVDVFNCSTGMAAATWTPASVSPRVEPLQAHRRGQSDAKHHLSRRTAGLESDIGLGHGAAGGFPKDGVGKRTRGNLTNQDEAATRSVVTDAPAASPAAALSSTDEELSAPLPHWSMERQKKLSAEEVATIFEARLERTGQRSQVASRLARQFGVAPRTVRDIWNLRTWVKTTRALRSDADVTRPEANEYSHGQQDGCDDFGGWKLSACWLVPGEELIRDELDVVLDKMLASASAEERGRGSWSGGGASSLRRACDDAGEQPGSLNRSGGRGMNQARRAMGAESGSSPSSSSSSRTTEASECPQRSSMQGLR